MAMAAVCIEFYSQTSQVLLDGGAVILIYVLIPALNY